MGGRCRGRDRLSAYYEVYVAAASTLDEVAAGLRSVVDTTVAAGEHLPGGRRRPRAQLRHRDERDRSRQSRSRFSHYPYVVTVRLNDVRGRARALAAAEYLFSAVGRFGWGRMLVFDAQVLLQQV